MTQRRTRQPSTGIRQALHAMQEALGDPAALRDVYEEAKRGSISSRLLLGMVDRVYPARPFLRLAHELDRSIRSDGYSTACRQAAERLVGPWQTAISSCASKFLETGSAIFYGNHPSLMTPFLLGAAVPRDDLRFVSTGYVCRLIPEFGLRSFAVEMPLDRVTTELRRGGSRRVLAHALMSLLHAVPDQTELKARNRHALTRAAEHVRGGGALVICPDGGGKRSGRWYPGIAQIARSLREAGATASFIPFHEADCTNGRIYARLMRGVLPALRRKWHQRKPVHLSVGEPIPLADLPSDASNGNVLDALRDRYEDLQRRERQPLSVSKG